MRSARARIGLLATLLALCGAAAALSPQLAVAKPRTLIAFLPQEPLPKFPLLRDFSERGMAVGLTSPTLGGYSKRQMLLDIGQGSRVSTRVYSPRSIPQLLLVEDPPGGYISGWYSARRRADHAPGDVVPGLLAETVEDAGGRVAYAGVVGTEQLEAIPAADLGGRIDLVSLGTQGTLAARALELWEEADLLVVRLPPDALGLRALEELLAARREDDLVYALRAPPAGGLKLLPAGIAARGFSGVLRSGTSRRSGLVTATDVAPTLLEHLDLDVPDDMQGREIESRSSVEVDDVLEIGARLNVLGTRRVPTLLALLAELMLLFGLLGRLRAGAGIREALRIGFLGALWLPVLALAIGWLTPDKTTEVLTLSLGSLALGALTDRFARWPIGPAIPAAVMFGAYALDLARGSPLIGLSLTGSNPRFGARFFGIGNELEAILIVGLLLGAGAALTRVSPRWVPRGFALIALIAAVIIGAGRLGADVGGVITIGAGFTAAVIASLATRPSRRVLALAATVPILGVVGLVALDLATGGGAHLTRLVEGGSTSDILEAVWRRFRISVSGLDSGTAPISVGLGIVLLVLGALGRDHLLEPLRAWDPDRGRAFRAGVVGAWFATVIGALVNDSGPVIVLIGTTGLLLAVAYVRSQPGAKPAAASE